MSADNTECHMSDKRGYVFQGDNISSALTYFVTVWNMVPDRE